MVALWRRTFTFGLRFDENIKLKSPEIPTETAQSLQAFWSSRNGEKYENYQELGNRIWWIRKPLKIMLWVIWMDLKYFY